MPFPGEGSVFGDGLPRRHLLTIALEDYYHVGAFNHLIQRRQWYRFESRLEQSTLNTLDLLDEFGLHATFFVLGWVGDTIPEIVRRVADRGHEIASKGYYHRSIRQMTPSEFRDDLARAREALERASGRKILGHRVADQWFTPADLWALDVLAEEGYEYDSSIAPMFRTYAAEPWRRFAHTHHFGERTLWEFPISSAELFGWHLPIAGGNYFRQFPFSLMRRAVAHWDRTYSAPFVMYFHVWELDPDQPKIAAPIHQRIRQYRNLEKMPSVLRSYFSRYRFTGIADHLGLSTFAAVTSPQRAVPVLIPPQETSSGEMGDQTAPDEVANAGRQLVSVVVPCYNEELILPYLANTLKSVEAELESQYDLNFIFVDDCSVDGTWSALQRIFGSRPNSTLIRHEENRGVAGGIMTGLRRAESEIVCSIDCDCTYDPHELARMIPMLRPEVDLVTASPYHPLGRVLNVPAWRLALSRTLSRAYRLVLPQKLRTYTSCFRVYRRSALLPIELQRGGFLGVAEMVGLLALAGSKIVEYPATLEARILGRSKMKILRTIVGHLGLLRQFAYRRLTQRRGQSLPSARSPEPRQSGRRSVGSATR